MNRKSLKAQALVVKRSSIFKGTIILTLAGFITRIIGFFYRIFLSNTMGAEKLGIYQLVFPVYGICFTIYATGLQTSISRLVAAEYGKRNHKNIKKILWLGVLISVLLAVILSILVYLNAEYIASHFLLEPRSAPSLRILAVVFPFCGITACINGYYYGLKKAGVPASTQLLEQIIRVILVYVVALYMGKGDMVVSCELAVFGLVIGEIASSVYNLLSLYFTKPKKQAMNEANSKYNSMIHPKEDKVLSNKKITKELINLSIPLSGNRLLISILHSIEAILIPTMLRRSGLTISEALSIFGILNGMSIPFILFPTALINALAVLLLPTVSEAQAVNNEKLIGKTTAMSIKYSIIIGIISTGIFVVYGKDLGNAVFHNQTAGDYLVILAWLCPFIYLTTTLGSIINGLGKVHVTFLNSVLGISAKIALNIFLIPKYGINGYLISLLIGQLVITVLDCYAVLKYVHFHFDAVNSFLKPGIIVALTSFILKETYEFTKKMTHWNDVILILSYCFILCVISFILLIITHTISKKDFK